tara:strand:- start:2444 stop:3766 length:1323 start_codon:yes stop_codon:yes gene_type:complete
MINKKGLTSLKTNSSNSSLNPGGDPYTIRARVLDIILSPSHPLFKSHGYWSSIGSIVYSVIDPDKSSISAQSPEFSSEENVPRMAKPYCLNNITYPTVNEIVLIFRLRLPNPINPLNPYGYFYTSPFNLWNQSNSNFMPSSLKTPDETSTNSSLIDSYQETPIGLPIPPPEDQPYPPPFPKNSTNSLSQDTFSEKPSKPLLPFAGDVIIQGRYENSIRFSSTSKPKYSDSSNNWSESGDNGSPIILLKNGQNSLLSPSLAIPITEDINKDFSSIYATSTQKIPIEVKNENYTSYSSPVYIPELPSQYTNPQVIINSDRLVFNAKKDSILLSAEKSVFLGANSSLNFNAGINVVIECSDIKLGDKSAVEPLILGDTFLKNLNVVLTKLDHLCTQLSVDQIWPAGAPVANGGVITVANSLKVDIANFKANMSSYKSQVSKTK